MKQMDSNMQKIYKYLLYTYNKYIVYKYMSKYICVQRQTEDLQLVQRLNQSEKHKT